MGGSGVRRAKREWQWRSCGAALDLQVAPGENFRMPMRHTTPMLRQLQGLPMQLQHNKITNLRLAVAPLDGRVLEPGQRLSFWRFVGKSLGETGFPRRGRPR